MYGISMDAADLKNGSLLVCVAIDGDVRICHHFGCDRTKEMCGDGISIFRLSS